MKTSEFSKCFLIYLKFSFQDKHLKLFWQMVYKCIITTLANFHVWLFQVGSEKTSEFSKCLLTCFKLNFIILYASQKLKLFWCSKGYEQCILQYKGNYFKVGSANILVQVRSSKTSLQDSFQFAWISSCSMLDKQLVLSQCWLVDCPVWNIIIIHRW